MSRDCRYITSFIRRFEVQNLWSRFRQSLNMNLFMGVQSRDLLDQTLNHRLGSGLNPVLEVQELDRGQSICYDAHLAGVHV